MKLIKLLASHTFVLFSIKDDLINIIEGFFFYYVCSICERYWFFSEKLKCFLLDTVNQEQRIRFNSCTWGIVLVCFLLLYGYPKVHCLAHSFGAWEPQAHGTGISPGHLLRSFWLDHNLAQSTNKIASVLEQLSHIFFKKKKLLMKISFLSCILQQNGWDWRQLWLVN